MTRPEEKKGSPQKTT